MPFTKTMFEGVGYADLVDQRRLETLGNVSVHLQEPVGVRNGNVFPGKIVNMSSMGPFPKLILDGGFQLVSYVPLTSSPGWSSGRGGRSSPPSRQGRSACWRGAPRAGFTHSAAARTP